MIPADVSNLSVPRGGMRRAQFYVYAYYAQDGSLALSTWNDDDTSKDREVEAHKRLSGPSKIDPKFDVMRSRVVVLRKDGSIAEDWVRVGPDWVNRVKGDKP